MLKFLRVQNKLGIMVFKSPNPRFHMKDLYHICKPTTKQVLPLPNPKTKYTTQKVAIVVRSMNPLHYKIVHLSEPKDRVLQTKDKKLYRTSRVEIFDSNEWVWSSFPDLVKLPFSVSLTNPQPITTRCSIYMLLTNGRCMFRNMGNLNTACPSDQTGTSKQLVKYSGKLGLAFTWEKVYVFTMNQDIGNKPIKAGLYDGDTRAVADRGTIISYMFKGGHIDRYSQIFNFTSDFEPTEG